jgi:hypothetical protein
MFDTKYCFRVSRAVRLIGNSDPKKYATFPGLRQTPRVESLTKTSASVLNQPIKFELLLARRFAVTASIVSNDYYSTAALLSK